jgi:GGDEF domain-containing protein
LIVAANCFKAINDMHGHAIGDRVLAGLVARTASFLRGDTWAPPGGE